MSATPHNNKRDKITTRKKREDGSIRLSYTCRVEEGKPRTEQAHKVECDIRNIVRRYAKAGVPIPPINAAAYSGEDYIAPPDFVEAMRIVANANSIFKSLPSKIRDRFENDPKSFLEFMHSPATVDEAVALGLATKRPASPPPDAPEVPSKPAKAPPKTPPATDGGGQPKGGSDQ